MPKGINDKKGKVGGVKGAGVPDAIEKAGAVSDVEKTKKASSVGRVKGAGRLTKERSTRLMSRAERDALFQIIEEEADKLFGKEGLTKGQRRIVEDAVKMTVDASLVDDDEEGKK